jgi:hypothetical protein
MMSYLTSWSVIVVAGVLAISSCGCSQRPTNPNSSDSNSAPPPTALNLSGKEIATSQGKYIVVYSTQPSPIPHNEPFTMQVNVLERATRAPVAGDVGLEVDGRMPHHRHGMNTQPQVTRQSAGTFHVEGMLFHMPGRWELYFDLSSDGRTERAQDVVMLE